MTRARVAGDATRVLRGLRSPSWGLLDQLLYSGTNLAASIVVARLLGSESFGVFALALAVWGVLWVVSRSLFGDPFTIRAALLRGETWRSEARLATGAVLGAGVAAAGGTALAVALLPLDDVLRRILLLLAVLLPALLLQDFLRVAAFARGRGGSAVLNDGVWAIVQLAALGGLVVSQRLTPSTALLAWGLGALAGCGVGAAQLRVCPAPGTAAFRWSREALRLGGAFGAAQGSAVLAGQLIPLGVGAILGTTAVGGLRAGMALFGPVLCLARAAELAVLPELVRLRSAGGSGARLLVAITIVLTSGAMLYSVPFVLAPEFVLRVVYGAAFEPFAEIVLPLAAMHVAVAVSTAWILALKATARGKQLLALSGAFSFARLGAALAASTALGLAGVAWAMAAGSLALGAAVLGAGSRAIRGALPGPVGSGAVSVPAPTLSRRIVGEAG